MWTSVIDTLLHSTYHYSVMLHNCFSSNKRQQPTFHGWSLTVANDMAAINCAFTSSRNSFTS